MEDILLTVQEWLGEDNKLGIDIWKRKYRYNNETFDEWLERVSGGNENLRNLIKEKKFMFGGRITANRNTNKKASMMNCFVAGTKVITKRGLINIENVVIGDEVITEDNTWQTVNNIMSHEYDGDLYKIDAVGLYNSIICSPNHKFLTQNGWKRADRLLAGEHSGRINSPDKLKIPCFNYSYNKSEIDFSQHFKSEKKRIVNIGDNRIIVETCEKNHGTECWKKHGYSIPHTIIPDDDFFYFIGRWLGDGSITRVKGKKSTQPSILQIVFNKTTEENDALYIASIGEKYFGFKPTITYTKQNVIAVRFCNEIVGSWFLGEFGQKCDGKFVPKKYFGNFPMALGLLDSDGCISTHGNFKIVLKNKNLISWLRDSLFLNGYPTQPIYDVKRQKNTYMFSISSYIINQRLMQHMKKKSWDFKNGNSPSESYLYRDYINITSINILENQKCKLFNLSVENNHTYTANGVVVHNCYSRGFIQDSLDDIMQANTDIALTFKTQGGQGLSLSKIRPKGCGINHGQFKSDGIIPFMELYNRTTESISQGGSRKGALLIGLDIWHKEAEDFIKIKSEEGRIQKANLSLEIDDEFMECVKKYYETGEIITKHIKKDYNGNIVEYDVVPVNLYKLMMSKAYDWAEPGCIFTNKFRNYNLMEYCPDYTIEICNPCVTGDTKILTDKGHYPISELVGKEVNIWNGFKFSQVVPRKTGENQKLMEVKFSNGSKLVCTPYHKFILKDGRRVECNNLSLGDKLQKCEMPVINGNQEVMNAYTQGFFSGDGFECKDRNYKYISFYGSHKKPLSKYCATINQRENSEKRTTFSVNVEHGKDFVPVNDYTIESKVNWLAGIVDSDGSNNEDGSITITSIDCNFIKNIFYMLQTLGVSATFNKCKEENEKFFPMEMGNKVYHSQDLYRISISASDVIRLNKLGFSPHRVANSSIPNRDAKRYIEVKSVRFMDTTADVYCFTENDNHSGIFNGIYTAQCGEQPLGKNSACDLGSINLSEFVIYPFSSNAQFEFDEFERAIDIGVRALDEIIDENQDNHALEEQKEMSLNYRNIGLGTMGMWDMLCKLNMKYGSDESKEFVNDLFRFMFRSAVISSSNLAREKGTFPRYSPNVLESSIIKEHFTDSELKLFDIDEYGLRNCSLLSIAPTGSIGTMLNISTGCEPAFQISYKRKTESLNSKDTYYDVYIQLAKDYMKKNNTKSLPSTFVSAADIDWKDRIDMQSILQKHVDTAISSTINLSKDISGKEIEELYLYAWEKGLKGVTIFRDGCARTGILSTDSKNENCTKESYSVDDLPRGTVIKADDNCIGRKRTLQTGCGTLHCEAFFDPDDGSLLETYFSKGSSGGCGQFMVGLSRMISLAARGGVDIYSIVDQLKSSGTCPSYAVRNAIKHDTSKGSSCPVAIGNALVDMYEEVIDEIYGGDDDTENEEIKCNEISNIKHAKCPQCGGNLVFEGGCNTCKDCGWSKCD